MRFPLAGIKSGEIFIDDIVLYGGNEFIKGSVVLPLRLYFGAFERFSIVTVHPKKASGGILNGRSDFF